MIIVRKKLNQTVPLVESSCFRINKGFSDVKLRECSITNRSIIILALACPPNFPYVYAGMEYDAGTGLYHTFTRYYSPTLQRFLSAGSIGYSADDSNLLAYTRNDATNRTDPSGNILLEAVVGGHRRYRRRTSSLYRQPKGYLDANTYGHRIRSCDRLCDWSHRRAPLAKFN